MTGRETLVAPSANVTVEPTVATLVLLELVLGRLVLKERGEVQKYRAGRAGAPSDGQLLSLPTHGGPLVAAGLRNLTG